MVQRIFGCCDDPGCPYCHGSGVYESNDAPADDAPLDEWLAFLRRPPEDQDQQTQPKE